MCSSSTAANVLILRKCLKVQCANYVTRGVWVLLKANSKWEPKEKAQTSNGKSNRRRWWRRKRPKRPFNTCWIISWVCVSAIVEANNKCQLPLPRECKTKYVKDTSPVAGESVSGDKRKWSVSVLGWNYQLGKLLLKCDLSTCRRWDVLRVLAVCATRMCACRQQREIMSCIGSTAFLWMTI